MKIGDRFGRWVVVEIGEDRDPYRAQMIWCHCECGTERLVRAGSLTRGASLSCGCYHADLASALSKRRYEIEKARGVKRHRARFIRKVRASVYLLGVTCEGNA